MPSHRTDFSWPGGRNNIGSTRVIAIGDIHGHADALRRLLQQVKPRPTDTIVTLGDYVNRGPDSRGVVDTLIDLSRRCRLVPLLGNHDDMMLAARDSRVAYDHLLYDGGAATLNSYARSTRLANVSPDHWRFLEGCRLLYETDSHFFVHANYQAELPLERQDRTHLLWLSLYDHLPAPHMSGKTAVVGHTPQMDGRILDLGYLKCIDTGCGFGGLLTAFEVHSGETWQVDETGALQ